jgi:hypothetical protein
MRAASFHRTSSSANAPNPGLTGPSGERDHRPDGEYIVPPLWDRPGVLVAELDLERVRRESMTLDVSGHYSRPDCLSLTVHRPSRRPVADPPFTAPLPRPNEVPA